MTQKVGIVGLGRMGMAAARKFIRDGYGVVGYARRPEVIAELQSFGGVAAGNPREVAQQASTVIVFVLNDPQVIEVVTGTDGALAGCGADSIIICMSTINRDNLERVAEASHQRGVAFVDSPCTGGPLRIEKGTLTMIVGAPADLVDRCRPVMEVMGRIVHVGETPGMGQAVKHCNQLVVGGTHALVMEAILMATKSGLDPKLVCQVIGEGIAGSDYFRLLAAGVLEKSPSPGGLGQMCKDVGIVVNSGRRLNLPLLTVSAASQYFLAALSLGLEEREGADLYEVVERFSQRA